jgi:hypothetical protein
LADRRWRWRAHDSASCTIDRKWKDSLVWGGFRALIMPIRHCLDVWCLSTRHDTDGGNTNPEKRKKHLIGRNLRRDTMIMKTRHRSETTKQPKKAQSSESLTTVHKHHINALTRSGNGRSRSYVRVPKAKLSLVRALQSNLISFFNGK